MKLNYDCIRAVLLAVEECDFGEVLSLSELSEKLSNFAPNDVWYTVLKLNEAGLLDATVFSTLNRHTLTVKSVNDITFQGHEFLNNIKDKSVWDKTKKIAAKVGASSLQAIGEIATAVISSAIGKVLKLGL